MYFSCNISVCDIVVFCFEILCMSHLMLTLLTKL